MNTKAISSKTFYHWAIHVELLLHYIPSNRRLLFPITIHSWHNSPDRGVAYVRHLLGIALSDFKGVIEFPQIRFQRFEATSGKRETARSQVERIRNLLKGAIAQ